MVVIAVLGLRRKDQPSAQSAQSVSAPSTVVEVDQAIGEQHVSASRRLRTTNLTLTIVTLVLSLAGLTGLATNALLTDSKSVTANTVTTATVTLNTSVTTAAITATALAPGDTTYTLINVSNAGTTPLRYSLQSTTDATDNNFLAAQLQLAVVQSSTCTSGTSFTTPLYNGIFGSTSTTNVLGNPAQGAQTGDRSLASSASEGLCFRLNLPATTTNTYAGKTVTATLLFSAEQTANNP